MSEKTLSFNIPIFRAGRALLIGVLVWFALGFAGDMLNIEGDLRGQIIEAQAQRDDALQEKRELEARALDSLKSADENRTIARAMNVERSRVQGSKDRSIIQLAIVFEKYKPVTEGPWLKFDTQGASAIARDIEICEIDSRELIQRRAESINLREALTLRGDALLKCDEALEIGDKLQKDYKGLLRKEKRRKWIWKIATFGAVAFSMNSMAK